MATLNDHCMAVYKALEAHAKPMKVDDDDCLVFEGSLTEIWLPLKISQSYYSKVFSFLRDSDSISVIQRGSRMHPSLIVLNGEPPPVEGHPANPLTRPTEHDKLASRVAHIESRLGGMNVLEAIRDLDERVKRLEDNG